MPTKNITNEIITSFLDQLYYIENEQLKDLRDFAEKNHVPVILKDTEGLLAAVMKLKKPANVLEIGTAVGYSACFFADCCGCRVTTIESDEESYISAVNNIRELGFSDKITVIKGDAAEVLKDLNGSFDMVFIDAAKSHYKEFWDLALPMCTDEALIICDNVLMKGMTASDSFDTKGRYKTSIRRMREFIAYIKSLDYADTVVLPVGDGVSISIIYKEDRPDE
ncbi:MAG: O-methyltransferase [Bacillota bacterium]|nr:O-methyltransferase [Bacillota bacterium]